jgi:hypothetical protein
MVGSTARRKRDAGAIRGWRLGWLLGGGAVVVAAGLLVAIIGLARRVAGQAGEIEGAVDAAAGNTAALFEVQALNRTLERMAAAGRARPEPA